ncbi:MAG TPA: RimK/LysX family protein [Candidatus Competibacteraceae bacterium]|nr:RimK/LysX family protein [Candidatus Competibacteraceae bacterium]
MAEKVQLGWREWLSLPALGVPALKAKVDTGARTSALHVFELGTCYEHGRRLAVFRLHPLQKRTDIVVECKAEMVDERWVRNPGGQLECRPVIITPMRIGTLEWSIEITLTNRDDMLFRMLLGRTALAGRCLIDPAYSYLQGRRCPYDYDRSGIPVPS